MAKVVKRISVPNIEPSRNFLYNGYSEEERFEILNNCVRNKSYLTSGDVNSFIVN